MAGSRWDQIVRTHLDTPIDKHFGEPVVVTPMRSTANGRRTVDPDRTVVLCDGVFTRKPRRTDMQLGNRKAGGQGGHDLRSLVEGTLPRLSVLDSAFKPGAAPRQGDRVEVGDERYEVVSARHDSVSRFNLDLIAIGG